MSDYYQHPSAIVDNGAQIGKDSRVWHFVHICAEAVIGERCSMGQNVFIGNKVVIGNDCKIQNNVSIYDNVTLVDGVFCGPSMVFTNVYNPRSFVDRKDEYMSTLVKTGASMGANCTIICGNTIGKFAFIGAATLVNNPLSNYIPSRPIQLYAAVDDDAQDNEIERLKQMAAKLRSEAASLEAEKAQQLADAAEKAFQKFDINSDGEVSLSELKTGLEKELKVCISYVFLACTYYLMLYLTQYISLQSIP